MRASVEREEGRPPCYCWDRGRRVRVPAFVRESWTRESAVREVVGSRVRVPAGVGVGRRVVGVAVQARRTAGRVSRRRVRIVRRLRVERELALARPRAGTLGTRGNSRKGLTDGKDHGRKR